jgi:hypothetical protein
MARGTKKKPENIKEKYIKVDDKKVVETQVVTENSGDTTDTSITIQTNIELKNLPTSELYHLLMAADILIKKYGDMLILANENMAINYSYHDIKSKHTFVTMAQDKIIDELQKRFEKVL